MEEGENLLQGTKATGNYHNCTSFPSNEKLTVSIPSFSYQTFTLLSVFSMITEQVRSAPPSLPHVSQCHILGIENYSSMPAPTTDARLFKCSSPLLNIFI